MSYTSAPELLIDFIDKSSKILQNEIGLDAETANIAAEKLAKFIKNDWGGQQIYFPKCSEDYLSSRDIDLWRKFNGTNHASLAREFNVSVQWVYKVIRFMRCREIATKQIDAFPDKNLQLNTSRRHA